MVTYCSWCSRYIVLARDPEQHDVDGDQQMRWDRLADDESLDDGKEAFFSQCDFPMADR